MKIGGLSRGLVLLVLALMMVAASAQAPAPEVTVRTSLERTAMFVADRVAYTVDITCRRGVDLLTDDLSRDKLKLDGLEVVTSDSDRRTSADGGTTYTFRYVLTTYRTDAPTLTIRPLAVRYAVRRPGQRLEDAVPAGEVQVAGATIALRSALPDEETVTGIRSDKPPHSRPPLFAALQSIGIALVIVSVAPALLAIAAVVRRVRAPRLRRSPRLVRREEHASLEAVRAMDVDTPERRRAVFGELDRLVREHLRDACGVPGASVTSHDVASALAAVRTTVPVELVTALLATCEAARYGPPDAVPSAEACRQGIEQVEQIVG